MPRYGCILVGESRHQGKQEQGKAQTETRERDEHTMIAEAVPQEKWQLPQIKEKPREGTHEDDIAGKSRVVSQEG